MTITADLSIEADGWSLLPGAEAMVGDAVAAAASMCGVPLLDTAEVCVLLCDDARIRELNRQYRGYDKPTNVLSFPANVPGPLSQRPLLGDIAIALETTAREAEGDKKPFAAHVTHLVVHGFLHLVGYDHESDDAAEPMERLETQILATLGIADPYASEGFSGDVLG